MSNILDEFNEEIKKQQKEVKKEVKKGLVKIIEEFIKSKPIYVFRGINIIAFVLTCIYFAINSSNNISNWFIFNVVVFVLDLAYRKINKAKSS